MIRNIVILGSTGSIGENALRVAKALPEQLRIVGLATRTRVQRMMEQAVQFGVKTVAVGDVNHLREAEELAKPHGIRVLPGEDGVRALSALPEADTVLCAVVGLAGLRPVLAAMDAGKDIALATKEVLVSAGDLVMRRRAETNVSLLPVDSEHSAIFQCLQSSRWEAACVRPADTPAENAAEERVSRLLLTASGGPFAGKPEIDFDTVTPEQALHHPRWSMGPKVTIDSATMMNKGLEILEAHELFHLSVSRIDVLIHPQSVVHSMVAFTDGTMLAQLSRPDMRFPIQYALTWPERRAVSMPALDLAELGRLDFSHPDETRFPCLRIAREAMQVGGTMPAVMNAADEVAVDAFLNGRIRFSAIPRAIDAVLARYNNVPCDSFDAVFAADAWARRETKDLLSAL